MATGDVAVTGAGRRKRLPAFLSAILAWRFPAAAGRHREHPPPAGAGPVTAFRLPEDDGWDWVSPAMMTRLDLPPARGRPYARSRDLR